MATFNIQNQAIKLVNYIFIITTKAPKKFRTDISSQLRNESLYMYKNLIKANNQAITNDNATKESIKKRRSFQQEIIEELPVIDGFLEIAYIGKVITFNQLKEASKLSSELYNSVDNWINSDLKRLNR